MAVSYDDPTVEVLNGTVDITTLHERHDMVDPFRLENDLVEKMRCASALGHLPEHELIQLLHTILTLQTDLQRIPLLDDELDEAVTSTQGLLNKWHEVVTRSFAVNQAKATTAQLGNWDNEGGTVEHTPYLL